jgi:hypothetical protein
MLAFLVWGEDHGHTRFEGTLPRLMAAYASAVLVLIALSPVVIAVLVTWWRLTRKRLRSFEASSSRRFVALATLGLALPMIVFALATALDQASGSSLTAGFRQPYPPWAVVSVMWLLLPRLLDPALRGAL